MKYAQGNCSYPGGAGFSSSIASAASGNIWIIPIAKNKPPAKQFENDKRIGFDLKEGTLKGIIPNTIVINQIKIPPKNCIILIFIIIGIHSLVKD